MKRRCEESIGAFDFGAFVGDLSVLMVDGWAEIAAKILKMVPLVIGSFCDVYDLLSVELTS